MPCMVGNLSVSVPDTLYSIFECIIIKHFILKKSLREWITCKISHLVIFRLYRNTKLRIYIGLDTLGFIKMFINSIKGSIIPQCKVLKPLRRQLLCLSPAQGREEAIINAQAPRSKAGTLHLFTLRRRCSPHHRGLIRLWISDRKFVNHTTEMIMGSMILT